MFPDPKPKSRLEVAIEDVLDEMAHHHTTTQEYGQLLERLTALHKLREKPQRPSPDIVIQSVSAARSRSIIRLCRRLSSNSDFVIGGRWLRSTCS